MHPKRPLLEDDSEKVNKLSQSQIIVYGDLEKFDVVGADKNKGAFISPILKSIVSIPIQKHIENLFPMKEIEL